MNIGCIIKYIKYIRTKKKTIEHLFEANGRTFQIEWQLKLLEEDIQGNILHVFFKTNKLKDFLINTPIKDYDNFLQFLIDNGTLKEMTNLNTGKDLLCSIYQICIDDIHTHFGECISLEMEVQQIIDIVHIYFSLFIAISSSCFSAFVLILNSTRRDRSASSLPSFPIIG